MEKNWDEYYELTGNKPHSQLLETAVGFINSRNKAIDIGAGALHDTKYLIELGFETTAIDSSLSMLKLSDNLNANFWITSFDIFNFGLNEYDIASAMYALPFNPPETFDLVFSRIKNGLVKGGIFCGQFFGINDSLSSDKTMTFHSLDQVKYLLDDMETLFFKEKDGAGATASGLERHWHVFHVIAKKI